MSYVVSYKLQDSILVTRLVAAASYDVVGDQRERKIVFKSTAGDVITELFTPYAAVLMIEKQA